MINLDTSLLRVFAAVADWRSMTAAANALNLTQGAVSQKVARLEAQAGTRLLERGQKGAKLTPQGERLLSKVRRMLELNDEILSQMNGHLSAGRVKFGVPVDLIGSVFAPILKRFMECFPHVELHLRCGSTEELRSWLADGSLDLVILEEPAAQAGPDSLLIDPLVWVGCREGTAHLRTPLPISLVSESCCFRSDILAALRERDCDARLVFENGGLEATLAVVRMDMAVSAWLASTVPADLTVLSANENLPDLPRYALNLHCPSAQPAPAVNELARHIREAFHRPTTRNPAQ